LLALQRDEDEIARLQDQVRDLASQSATSESAAAMLKRNLQDEQAQREQITSEREALSSRLTNAQTAIQSLEEKLKSADANANQNSVQVAALEANVRSLNVALEESNSNLNDRDRMLALDKDFLAHDRDIRDLIGARNLYIADIYDTTESGKTAKPFGRIFYTQNRSLVFYGFDTGKAGGSKTFGSFPGMGQRKRSPAGKPRSVLPG
jgi:hypothetical protein